MSFLCMETKSVRRALLAMTVGVIVNVLPMPSVAANDADIEINTTPPAPKDVQSPRPRDGYVWAPGFWRWKGNRFYWVDGSWLVERRAQHWVPDHWEQTESRWHFIPGRWQR